MVRHLAAHVAIEGAARTGKTRLLMQRVVHLLQSCPTHSVLVLCSNYYRKSRFLEQVQEHLTGGYSQINVTTYSALVRHTLEQFWPCVETRIAEKGKIGGKSEIFPNLSGFEASEYILKRIIHRMKQQNPQAFEGFSGSERSLVGQLIRRSRLRSENRLERQEMRRRSERIDEPCLDDVDEALKQFDSWSYRLRVLDNSRQLDVFHAMLEEDSPVRQYFLQNIRHLVVDDVDETIPAQQHFIRFLAPHLDTLALAADVDGGTRRGYLNASPYDWEGLKRLKPDMDVICLERRDVFFSVAGVLLKNWTRPDLAQPAELLPAGGEVVWRAQTVSRLDMVNQVVSDVVRLIQGDSEHGFDAAADPGDLVIVMPRVDTLARMQLQQQFKRRGIPLQILTGTQRPIDNPVCRSLLLLLQLVNQAVWELPLSPLEFGGVLRHALKLNHVDPEGFEGLVQAYRTGMGLSRMNWMPAGEHLNPLAARRYTRLLDWMAQYRDEPVEEQIYSAFSTVISPQLTPDDELGDVAQLIRSLYIQGVAMAFGENHADPRLAAREWLIQVKTGIVSDTPNKPREVDPKAMVLGTPQKIIDFEIERPYHFWLDMASREWSRTDHAPLYNAWVHSPHWDGSTCQASDSFNQLLTRTRAGHIVRTLTLYAQKRIFLYASELDDEGYAHTGIFPQMIRFSGGDFKTPLERATLRDDQAPVLTYRQGPMAITAVPGAGKTFVNVEFLLELIERGVAPDSILVLTYMDSAARTLLNRLKAKLPPDQMALPVVCTIHSLAFRMITEADHALYLGLDLDHLKVMDELEELDLLQDTLYTLGYGDQQLKDKPRDMLEAIKLAKTYQISPDQLSRISRQHNLVGLYTFSSVYKAYVKRQNSSGLLDFTDLILQAVRLLREFPDVRQKYRERFCYIIEDEAQDSSLMLQSFIQLLQGESGNLIRTGDTNQSITTTFSTADTSVFRNFIAHCHEHGMVIQMNQSSRCAEQVINLANRFLLWASQDADLRHAFQPIEMKPVPGKNPELLEPITAREFDTRTHETDWIAGEIIRLQALHPQATMAVLTRDNNEVLEVTQVLQNHGVKAISLSESPMQNPVYVFVVYFLRVLENPANREAVTGLVNHMRDMELVRLTPEEEELGCDLYGDLPFQRPQAIKNASLLQLYYNLHDLMRYSFGQDICRIIVRLSDMFLSDPLQRSIGYQCALKAQEWVDQQIQAGAMVESALEWVNVQFERSLKQRRLPLKVLNEAFEQPGKMRPFVQVMTLHKAKGQEFDFVFMPGMSESNFPSQPDAVPEWKIKRLELFIEGVRQNNVTDIANLSAETRRKLVEEEARLVYVGITRAKQGLYFSWPNFGRERWGKAESQEPSRYFTALQHLLTESMTDTRMEVTPYA